mgnify:CR=1 FL=1
MNKILRTGIYIVMGLTAVGIIVLCVVNICTNKQFWQFNIFNGITMLWTVGLSFIVTQSFSRYQRKADVLIKMLQELLDSISEYKTCQFSQNAKQEDILMQNRQIKQRIGLISQYAQKFGIKQELEFIDAKFKEYEETVSEHITDPSYLAQSYTVLARPIKLMQERIYQAILKI